MSNLVIITTAYALAKYGCLGVPKKPNACKKADPRDSNIPGVSIVLTCCT